MRIRAICCSAALLLASQAVAAAVPGHHVGVAVPVALRQSPTSHAIRTPRASLRLYQPTLARASLPGSTSGRTAVALAATVAGVWRGRAGPSGRSRVGLRASGSQGEADDSMRKMGVALLACAAVAVLGAQGAWAADGGDFFEPIVGINAQIIEGIDGVVGSAGLAIVLYSLLIKVLTVPLNQMSMRSNVIMQALQPQMEEIRRRYESEEISDQTSSNLLNTLYGEFSVNPLTGLLVPLLVQLPVLVALFRAISKLAQQDAHFQQGFLWIPSLAGPAEVGKPSLDWLIKTRFSDHFEPLIGWDAAGLYLIMPVLLIALQLITQRIVPAPGNQGWTTYLVALFIGISALVTPQAVGIYWLVNTSFTAAQMKLVTGQVEEEFPKLMKFAQSAQKESEGVRYTRKSEVSEGYSESSASKAVSEMMAQDTPKPKVQTRSAKRMKQQAERRMKGRAKRQKRR